MGTLGAYPWYYKTNDSRLIRCGRLLLEPPPRVACPRSRLPAGGGDPTGGNTKHHQPADGPASHPQGTH